MASRQGRERLQFDVVNSAQAGVNRQNGKGQQEVDQRHHHGTWTVEDGCHRLGDDTQRDQSGVEDSLGSKNCLPRINLHQIPAEQRYHRDEQERRPPAPCLESNDVGIDKAQHCREQGDDGRHLDGETKDIGGSVVSFDIVFGRELGGEHEEFHLPETEDEEIYEWRDEECAEDRG